MKKIPQANRRDFLKGCGVAAGVIAFPTIVPSTALAAGGASSRISIGVIGLGKRVKALIGGALRDKRLVITALCDVETTRMQKWKDKIESNYRKNKPKGGYKGCKTYGDFRELIAQPGIDAVIIATPDHWHAIIAVTACRAGKHVYCEKPLGHTIWEAQMIANEAKRNNIVFQVGSQQRSDTAFRTACEVVRNGGVGKLHTVYASIGSGPHKYDLKGQPIPPSLNWDMWCGPAPKVPYNSKICPLDVDKNGFPAWRSFREFGGGHMLDFGAHHYDIAQWGIGADATFPIEVIPPKSSKDDLTWIYSNGVKLVRSRTKGMKGAAVTFVGDKGRIACNRGRYLKSEPGNLKDFKTPPNGVHLYKNGNHMGNWVDCMQSRKKTICPADIGYHSVTVCWMGVIAEQLRRPLKWDVSREEFIDPQARRMMKPVMRSPWRI